MTERVIWIAARPLIRRLVPPLELADLQQVGRLALWEKGQGREEAHQITIARNAMIDELRRARWVSRGAYEQGAAWAMDSYDAWEMEAPEGFTDDESASMLAVRQFLANAHRLNDKQRTVLDGLVAGLDHSEVAREMGISPSMVTLHVRALRQFAARYVECSPS